MHPAPAFRLTDRERLIDQLRLQPFVAVFAPTPQGLRVAHAPVVVRTLPSGVVLDFHLSKGNDLSPLLSAGAAALAVSLGPEAYISPDWYGLADQVPTWNYVSVEAEGPVTLLDQDQLIALLDDLSAEAEARLAPKPPWTRAKMSPGRFEAMVAGVRGFRLSPTRFEGVLKLAQNKPDAARHGVAEALADHPIGVLMGRGAPR